MAQLRQSGCSPIPYTTVFITPSWGRYSKLDCSTNKRVPIPNDTSAESSRRDASNVEPFWPSTLFQLLRRHRPWKIRREGCDNTPFYTVLTYFEVPCTIDTLINPSHTATDHKKETECDIIKSDSKEERACSRTSITMLLLHASNAALYTVYDGVYHSVTVYP